MEPEVGNLSLFLQNPTIVPVYRLYCCGLHLEHYVDLYVDINEYAANPEPNKQKLAKALFDKYFTKESLQRVDINSRVIEELNNKLASDNINAHVFSDVQTFILEFLKEKTLIGFLESPAYLRIIQRRKERASVFKKKEDGDNHKEEIENLSKKIREYQTFFTSLTAQVSKTLDSRETAVRNWQNVAQTLEQYSKTAENPNLQMALQTAKVIGVMEELQAKMNRVLVKNLENSLNNLVKSEISASVAAKKKFESIKKPQKGDPIVSETLTTLNDCSFKCDHQFQMGLCSILEEYYKLFETGHFYMHRNLPSLMDFRTTIQLDEMKDEGEEYQIGTRMIVSDQEMIKEGLLEKKGAKRRNWNQRWFVLKSKYLFYYNNNTEKILKGYIYLKNCTIESAYNKKKANCFSISTTFRTFLISASSDKEMKEWIHAIKSATFEAQVKLAEQSQKKQLETLLDAQANDFISDYLSSSNVNPQPASTDSSESHSGPLSPSPSNDSGALTASTDKGIETSGNENEGGSGKKKKDRSTKKSSGKSRRVKGSKIKKSKKDKEAKGEENEEAETTEAAPAPAPAKDKNLESLKEMLEASINSENPPPAADDKNEEKEEPKSEPKPEVSVPEEDDTIIQVVEEPKQEEVAPIVKAKSKKSKKKGESDDDDDYDESEEEEEGESAKEEVEVEQNKRLSRKATLMCALGGEPENPASQTPTPASDEVKDEPEEGKEEENQPRQSTQPTKGLNVLVKQGYLTKKGAKRRNWNTRWFILKHNHLAYYKNPGDREPKGVVILANCRVEPCDKKPYCFAIASSMRTYFIFAKNSAAQEEWMAAIKSCIP